MALVHVRYFAAAAEAAGVAAEDATANTLDELIELTAARHGPDLNRVLAVSSLMIDGVVQRDRGALLGEGWTIDVLPPFAGG